MSERESDVEDESRELGTAASSRRSPPLSVKRSRRAPPMTSRCRASKREKKTVREDERERERGSRSSHRRRTQSPSSSQELITVTGRSRYRCCC
ncbi:hypothetical protein AHAS_Ahas19G0192200 [Arachis hypogaea]